METVSGDSDVFASTIERSSQLADLLHRPVQEQQTAGYFHTVREICQQPQTWMITAATVAARRVELRKLLESCRAIVLNGSGSSQYAGDCLAPALRKEMGIPVEAASSGWLWLMGPHPARRPLPDDLTGALRR